MKNLTPQHPYTNTSHLFIACIGDIDMYFVPESSCILLYNPTETILYNLHSLKSCVGLPISGMGQYEALIFHRLTYTKISTPELNEFIEEVFSPLEDKELTIEEIETINNPIDRLMALYKLKREENIKSNIFVS